MKNREVTFSMIKPDATARNLTGALLKHLEDKGFRLQAGRLQCLSRSLCEVFYEEHQSKAFFSSLVEFVTSGPVFLMALSGEGAVKGLRTLIGHTDPGKADPGTLRALYGESVERNSIHASASRESALRELSLFFKKEEYELK